MSGSDEFLSRWSRRKREAAKGVANDDEQDSAHPRENGAPEQENADSCSADVQPAAKEFEKSEPAEPAFDLSKLPSLESITAETDIRPFLAAGVPASLRQAALRRVWSADPKIRDFIGLVENGWDFTGDSELLGFDFSPPGADVQRMVAEMFGDRGAEGSRSRASESGKGAEQPHEDLTEALPHQVTRDPDDERVAVGKTEGEEGTSTQHAAADTNAQNDESWGHAADTASQDNDAVQQGSDPTLRRPHGGAMPR